MFALGVPDAEAFDTCGNIFIRCCVTAAAAAAVATVVLAGMQRKYTKGAKLICTLPTRHVRNDVPWILNILTPNIEQQPCICIGLSRADVRKCVWVSTCARTALFEIILDAIMNENWLKISWEYLAEFDLARSRFCYFFRISFLSNSVLLSISKS